MLSVSHRSLRDAKTVLATGNKRLISAVEDGDIAVSIAAKLADQDQATQDEAVANPDRAHTIVKLKTREGHEESLATQIRGPGFALSGALARCCDRCGRMGNAPKAAKSWAKQLFPDLGVTKGPLLRERSAKSNGGLPLPVRLAGAVVLPPSSLAPSRSNALGRASFSVPAVGRVAMRCASMGLFFLPQLRKGRLKKATRVLLFFPGGP